MGQTTSTTSAVTSSTSSAYCPSYSSNAPFDFRSCPSVSLTPTLTTTFTASTTVYSGSYSDVTIIAQGTVYSTKTTLGTYYTYSPFTTGVTTQAASTVYVFSQAPFKKTVTVPTAPGFTPVACESTYRQPFPSTVTVTITQTTTILSRVPITSTTSGTVTYVSTIYSPVLTITLPYGVAKYVYTTPTTTITRTNPTSTKYNACNTLNVVNQHPYGFGYVSYAFPIEPAVQVFVPAIDQNDCCALCQANSSCLGTQYFSNPDYGVYKSCFLFLLDPNGSQTCNPSAVLGRVDNSVYPVATPVIYYSNGNCGQIQFYDDGNDQKPCTKAS